MISDQELEAAIAAARRIEAAIGLSPKRQVRLQLILDAAAVLIGEAVSSEGAEIRLPDAIGRLVLIAAARCDDCREACR